MDITVRSYTIRDYQTVKSILQSANMFEESWDGEANFASMIEKDKEAILVAETDGQVVGNIIISQHGNNVGLLFRLAVLPKWRKKGVGSLLIHKAEEVAKQKGMGEVALCVDEQKSELQDFYAKRGYLSSNHAYKWMWKSLK